MHGIRGTLTHSGKVPYHVHISEGTARTHADMHLRMGARADSNALPARPVMCTTA